MNIDPKKYPRREYRDESLDRLTRAHIEHLRSKGLTSGYLTAYLKSLGFSDGVDVNLPEGGTYRADNAASLIECVGNSEGNLRKIFKCPGFNGFAESRDKTQLQQISTAARNFLNVYADYSVPGKSRQLLRKKHSGLELQKGEWSLPADYLVEGLVDFPPPYEPPHSLLDLARKTICTNKYCTQQLREISLPNRITEYINQFYKKPPKTAKKYVKLDDNFYKSGKPPPLPRRDENMD